MTESSFLSVTAGHVNKYALNKIITKAFSLNACQTSHDTLFADYHIGNIRHIAFQYVVCANTNSIAIFHCVF